MKTITKRNVQFLDKTSLSEHLENIFTPFNNTNDLKNFVSLAQYIFELRSNSIICFPHFKNEKFIDAVNWPSQEDMDYYQAEMKKKYSYDLSEIKFDF